MSLLIFLGLCIFPIIAFANTGTISNQSDIVILAAVYGSLETAKVFGITDIAKGFLMGKKSVLTNSERSMLTTQLKQCAECHETFKEHSKAIDRQTIILEKIHEAIIEVKIRTDRR